MNIQEAIKEARNKQNSVVRRSAWSSPVRLMFLSGFMELRKFSAGEQKGTTVEDILAEDWQVTTESG